MTRRRFPTRTLKALVFIVCLGLLGIVTLFNTRATTPASNIEPETGSVSAPASTIADTSASGRSAVKFGTGSGGDSGTALCQGMAKWSNATTWGSAGVPVANASVTLPANAQVQVDVDVPHLSRVTVPAGTTLCFPDRATTFSAKQIIVLGTLQAGTPTHRLTSNVTIKLEGGKATDTDTYTVTGQAADAIAQYNTANADRCAPAPMGCIHVGANIGTNVLTAHNGGTISIYGQDSGLTWSDLASTSAAGSSTLNLRDAVTWQAGDQIVVASSDYDWTHEERKVVQSVSNGGKTITLTTPLTYKHVGISTCQTSGSETRCQDERAEVGLLTHNIKIAGPDDAVANNDFGGQVIILAGGHIGMDGVEMYHLGQKGHMARYPLHFHIMGDDGRNVHVSNISSHDDYNRFVDFHGTDYASLSGLVGDDTIGHGIMFEDGTEHDNTLTHNLVGGIQFNPNESERLRLSDEAPTAYWITNPDNNFIGNHAFGADGNGFWVDYGDNASLYHTVWDTWGGTFNDNVAHSNTGKSGLTSIAPHEEGNGFFVGEYVGNPDSATAVYRNNSWKNSEMGYWIDGAVTFTDSMAADNYVDVTMQNSHMKGGIFTYLTANTTTSPGDTGDGGGLLRAYHGAADYEGIWLTGYGGTPGTSQYSAITDSSAGITDHTPRVKDLKFFGPGYKVYFESCPYTASGQPITDYSKVGSSTVWADCYWGTAHGGNSHILYDMDGSILGNGVPVAITDSETFARNTSGPSTFVDTKSFICVGAYCGNFASRGLILPFSEKFDEFVPMLGIPTNGFMTRDRDGVTNDLTAWTMVEQGDRYHIDIDPSANRIAFQLEGMTGGYTDIYMDMSSAPSGVYRCDANPDFDTTCNKRPLQPEASSLAKLGVDGSWWYGNGKLYIRSVDTGDVPFGLANSTYAPRNTAFDSSTAWMPFWEIRR